MFRICSGTTLNQCNVCSAFTVCDRHAIYSTVLQTNKCQLLFAKELTKLLTIQGNHSSAWTVVGRRKVLGSYNTEHLMAFLNELEQACQGEDVIYVVVWDNVSFHYAEQVRECFRAHPQFMTLYLPPYSPFLNPIEELFSTWR